jgi:threonine aldolase
MGTRDFRSDTVTLPTPAMKEAMITAPLGDDVHDDDPTVKQLQQTAALKLGKEAAIFVPSGTFGNQASIAAHTQPGDEILLSEHTHIIQHEAGAVGLNALIQTLTIDTQDGWVTPEQLEPRIRTPEIHHPKTTLICLENALSNGRVMPLAAMQSIQSLAKDHTIPIHLDGARIFNAALTLQVSAKVIAACADSVMFCLSKGLGAPVGSMVCGSYPFIQRVKRIRKQWGGAMRQAGVLAAPGLVALETMIDRLKEDHTLAEYIATEFMKIPGIVLEKHRRDINMVFFNVDSTFPISADELFQQLLREGFNVLPPHNREFRLVTHVDVDHEDAKQLVEFIQALARG